MLIRQVLLEGNKIDAFQRPIPDCRSSVTHARYIGTYLTDYMNGQNTHKLYRVAYQLCKAVRVLMTVAKPSYRMDDERDDDTDRTCTMI